MSRIVVKLFARARDLAGSESVSLELPEGATVGVLRAQLVDKHPALGPLADKLLVAAGSKYVRDDDVVPTDVDIACFPPVSGG